MAYANWTDREWDTLLKEVRACGPLPEGLRTDDEIREVAFRYMGVGADGGGNAHGIYGTLIASCVDTVNKDFYARTHLYRKSNKT